MKKILLLLTALNVLLIPISSATPSPTLLTDSEVQMIAGSAIVMDQNPAMYLITIEEPSTVVSKIVESSSSKPMKENSVSQSKISEESIISSPITETKSQSTMTHSETHTNLSDRSVDLLYSVVQAEAGNQDFDGMRLVTDVVLNRVESSLFPNTIEDVVYQKRPTQFSITQNGSLKKAHGSISPKVMQAVDTELFGDKRFNTEILYFNNSNNGGWKYGDHWFK